MTIQNLTLTGLVKDSELVGGEFPKDWNPDASNIGGGVTGSFPGELKIINCLFSKMRPPGAGVNVSSKKVTIKAVAYTHLIEQVLAEVVYIGRQHILCTASGIPVFEARVVRADGRLVAKRTGCQYNRQ